ncbi:MAG: hypothetical protein EBV06_00840 [Planctomycetia bacterium]|nr:hypothetical protein [Planctomycetia bacterium]
MMFHNLRKWLQVASATRQTRRTTKHQFVPKGTAHPRIEALEDRTTPAAVDLTMPNGRGTINAAFFTNAAFKGGTGVVDPFVRIQGQGGTEQGYNSGANKNAQFDETGKYSSQYNKALLLSAIPVAYLVNPQTGLVEAYRELRLDINENSNSIGQQYLSLDALQIYQSTSSTLYGFTGTPTSTGTFTQGGSSSLRYNLDNGVNNVVLLNYDLQPGSGVGDVSVFIPDSAFDSSQAYVYVYSAMGYLPNTSGKLWECSDGFEEWSVGVGGPVISSNLTGYKFNDVNGNGVQDSGESGLSNWQIYIDSNNNNQLDWTDKNGNGTWDSGEGERWTTTDSTGKYTFDRMVPGQTLTVREVNQSGWLQTGPLNGTYPTGVTGENATVNNFTITITMNTANATYTLPSFGNAQQNPAIKLVKTAVDTNNDGYIWDDTNGNGLPDVGEMVHYTFTVTNTGNVTLKSVTVADTVGGVTVSGGSIVSLAPGAVDSTTFTGTYSLTQSDIDAGKFYNLAKANGTPPSGDPVSGTDDETVTLPQKLAIDLVKYVNGDDANTAPGVILSPIDAKTNVTFRYAMTNKGNVNLHGITLTDDKQGDILLKGMMISNGNGDTILDPGETWIYELTVPALPGQNTNVATATGLSPLGSPVSDTDPGNYYGNRAPLPNGSPLNCIEPGEIGSGTDKSTDPDGDDLVFTIVTQPMYGIAKVTDPSKGNYTYEANATFPAGHPVDTFTVQAMDKFGAYADDVIEVTLNLPPSAKGDTVPGLIMPGTSVVISQSSLLSNDSDPDNDKLTFQLGAGPTLGKLVDNGNGTYTYTAPSTFGGTTDTFTYSVSDGCTTSTATVTINLAYLNGGGGRSVGFWSSKNGQDVMFDNGTAVDELKILNSLNLRTNTGALLKDFSTSENDSKGYNEFRNWLKSSANGNPSYILSIQLAAMALNVEARFVNPDAKVYAADLLRLYPGGNSSIGLGADGSISINNLMSAADKALAKDSGATRDYLLALAKALELANTNQNFIISSSSPSLGGGGGQNIKYWTSKVGKLQVNDDRSSKPEMELLKNLNLKNSMGQNFDPRSYSSLRSWLKKANSTYMLSAQLAVMELNVEAGFVSGAAKVYAAGLLALYPQGNAAIGLGADGTITINNLKALANNLLGNGSTLTGAPTPTPELADALKTALDQANNNMNFVI